jgi:uncharacterized YigZ family protein
MEKPGRLLVPLHEARCEFTVDRSRFISTAGCIFSVDEARGFIKRIRHEFPDASHHVPAFLIGHGAGVTAHCSDDGEPSGTAGRPALTVLQGSGLGDVVVVVTRYFGGIKLGTGGLVHAYTEAVQNVLKILPVGEKVDTALIMLAFPYSYLERIRNLLKEIDGVVIDEEFAGDVTLTTQIRSVNIERFCDAITNMSHGTVNVIIIDNPITKVMPVI